MDGNRFNDYAEHLAAKAWEKQTAIESILRLCYDSQAHVCRTNLAANFANYQQMNGGIDLSVGAFRRSAQQEKGRLMTNVLVLSGANHGFAESAAVIGAFLGNDPGINVTITDDKEIFTSSSLAEQDVCVLGTGFTRSERHADGTATYHSELTADQQAGLIQFVAGGKGLVGAHGTGWWIGGQAADLIGGHANWHPPGLTFTVNVEDSAHPVMRGIEDFEVDDEIYMTAWDPAIHILASAKWSEKTHPMAWVKPYGQGRVFYTTLGHTSDTFKRPAMQRLMRQGTLWAADGAAD